jgi:hypothetical protein
MKEEEEDQNLRGTIPYIPAPTISPITIKKTFKLNTSPRRNGATMDSCKP